MIHWSNLADFLSMGGYGLYVWGAYGVTAVLMLIEPVLAWRRHRQAKAQAALARVVQAQQMQDDKEALQ